MPGLREAAPIKPSEPRIPIRKTPIASRSAKEVCSPDRIKNFTLSFLFNNLKTRTNKLYLIITTQSQSIHH